MYIACPNCATSYEIADSSLGAQGRMVRCVHCRSVWFVEPQLAEAAAAAAAGAAAAAPSMWQEEQSAGGAAWPGRETLRPGSRPIEDRFAGDEVEFALPSDIPQLEGEEAPPLAADPAEAEFAATDAPAPEDDAVQTELPPEEMADLPPPEAEPEIVTARRRRPVERKSITTPWFSITKPRVATALTVVVLALVFGRHYVARAMPQMASLYEKVGLSVNLRGLALEAVKADIEKHDGIPVLVIEGAIRNLTRDSIEVPRLRFAMRNSTGAEIYSWTLLPERPLLPPGEGQTFKTRLASPPADSKQIHVRFFQRRDIAAASQSRTSDGTYSPRGR